MADSPCDLAWSVHVRHGGLRGVPRNVDQQPGCRRSLWSRQPVSVVQSSRTAVRFGRAPPQTASFWSQPWISLVAIGLGIAALAWARSRRKQASKSPSADALRRLEASMGAGTAAKSPVTSVADGSAAGAPSVIAAMPAPPPQPTPPPAQAPAPSSTPSTTQAPAPASTQQAPAPVTSTSASSAEPSEVEKEDALQTVQEVSPQGQDEMDVERISLVDGRCVRVFPDATTIATAVVTETARIAKAAIAEKGAFSMAVSGGEIASSLKDLSKEAGLDFSKFHVFYCYDGIGELQCHKEARSRWLDACGIPVANVHIVPDMVPEGAAAQYTANMCMQEEEVIADSEEGLPAVDLVLLSTGDDGQCGGVRPNSPEAEKVGSGEVVLFRDSPAELSLSLDFMSAARHALLLATDASRAEVVCKALSNAKGDASCPAGLVRSPDTKWFVTRDSVAEYKKSR